MYLTASPLDSAFQVAHQKSKIPKSVGTFTSFDSGNISPRAFAAADCILSLLQRLEEQPPTTLPYINEHLLPTLFTWGFVPHLGQATPRILPVIVKPPPNCLYVHHRAPTATSGPNPNFPSRQTINELQYVACTECLELPQKLPR